MEIMIQLAIPGKASNFLGFNIREDASEWIKY
jgi:hypothetical protein